MKITGSGAVLFRRSIVTFARGLIVAGVFILTTNATLHATETATTATLSLSGANVSTLNSLSDSQLTEFMNELANTPTVSADLLPRGGMGGTYFSLQNPLWPPLPGDMRGIPVWFLDDGSYLLDDMDVSYAQPKTATKFSTSGGVQAMDVPSPGGGGTNSGDGFYSDSFVRPDYGTNLWIRFDGISSGSMIGIISNSTADVELELQSKTNLSQTNWNSETFVLGSEITNWTSWSLSVAGNTNDQFFVRVRSWIDSQGVGIPDWWQLKYFGYVGIDPFADPDGDGYNNLEEFQNGTDPTVFNSPPKGVSNVQATMNGTTNTVTWNPSSSATSYTVTRTSGTNVTSYTVSADATSYTDAGAPDGSTYTVTANYSGGDSPASGSADPTYNSVLAIDPEIVRGATPSDPSLTPVQIVLGGIVPTNVAAIRVYKSIAPLYYNYNYSAYEWELLLNYGDQGWSSDFVGFPDDGSFDIPISSFVNGVYQIPVSQLPEWCAYYLATQPIDSNGHGGVTNDYVYVRNVPFVDGTAVLKNNLSFLMRSAQNGASPYDVSVFDFEADYNYAAVSPMIQHMEISPDLVTEMAPFNDNAFMRNWNYDTNFATYPFGSYNYYFFWYDKNLGTFGGYYQDPTNGFPKYEFDGYTYVNTLDSTMLTNQLTNDYIYLETDVPSEIGYSGDDIPYAGLTWNGGSGQTTLTSGWQNHFGLSYQSVKICVSRAPLIGQEELTPGNSYSDPSPGDYSEYFQKVAAPSLTTVDYYFTEASDRTDENANSISAMPNDGVFSVTNTTPLIIAGVGEPITIYGWAKQQISNGDSTKFGYLGQYFDPTSVTNGILSEYGDFMALQPGQITLKTKPDSDQGGLQGSCPVYAVGLNVDANRDGTMDLTYQGPDTTSEGNPFVFWINNDYDFSSGSADPFGHDIQNDYRGNYQDPAIACPRDLEDFARLWICGMPALPSGQGYTVTLSWQNTSGSPAINLVNAVESNGGTLYLTDSNTAAAQVVDSMGVGPGQKYQTISTANSLALPSSLFTSGGNKYFLFEGAGIGKGQLVLTILQNGNPIAQSSVWMDLHDVRSLYERAVITDNTSGSISNWSSTVETVQPALSSALADDNNLIVFVHGINVDDWHWFNDSDTVFKRLYWAGYHGKFATVKWPCNLINYLTFLTLDVDDFNDSEIKAYKASTALKTYLSQLHSRFPSDRLNLFVHSQGNAVVSEAIRQGAPFDTYILTQGALPANCYDVNAPADPTLVGRESYFQTPEWQPMGYHGIYTNFTGNIVNFFNSQDKVLGYWYDAQEYFKPSISYSYDGTNSIYTGGFSSYIVTDSQESRANVSRSRTLPVGAQTGLNGVISSAVDLNAQFGFNGTTTDEHSAQWTRPIQTSRPYYQQVLRSFLIEPAP